MKKQLRKKEIKEINNELQDLGLDDFFLKTDKVEIIENDLKLINCNDEHVFFYHEGRIVPTLKLLQRQDILKTIEVDKGAIPFVVKGADIMRPGITFIDEDVSENEIIVIKDEEHKKPLAVGISLYDGKEMKEMEKGKVIRNLHYVGDSIWNSG